MYVCMYVCMYVSIHLCFYSCMYVCQEELHRRSGQVGVLSANLTALEVQSNSRQSSLEDMNKRFETMFAVVMVGV